MNRQKASFVLLLILICIQSVVGKHSSLSNLIKKKMSPLESKVRRGLVKLKKYHTLNHRILAASQRAPTVELPKSWSEALNFDVNLLEINCKNYFDLTNLFNDFVKEFSRALVV